MPFRNFCKCFCAAVLIHCVSGFAEKFNLDIYASRFDSIPIAVVQFQPSSGAALTRNQPWQIIADDLAFTGKFDVSRLHSADSSAFASKNIGIFIYGDYAMHGDRVSMNCYLHDATTGNLILGRKYTGKAHQLRAMSHRYVNELYEMILGEKGIFASKIVFVQDKGTQKNLYIMDFDGHNLKRITALNTVNLFPVFADSATIVWTSYLRGKPDLYRGSIASGKSSIYLYSRFVETSPDISSIEDMIAFASSRNGNLDVYTCGLDKSGLRRLTFNRGIDTSPCWSPNGYHIAFTSDRSGSPQIYLMDRDGANTRRLTFNGKYQDSPAWSPKGDKIAFASMQNGKFDIWTIETNGRNARQVTGISGNNEYPCWSPDGSHIAFARTAGGKSDIYWVREDGTDLQKLTSTGNAKMPDWSSF
ncbi:MAG: hypothetical protein GF398_17575 [Chitinivibrionales bacterium]|nr:hypothetical protein [Chitinivibrionales bacterium]